MVALPWKPEERIADMTEKRAGGLSAGERCPDFVAPMSGGMETRFYARAGGRVALLVFAAEVGDAVRTMVADLDEVASLHFVVPEASGATPIEGLDIFLDDGVVRTAFRLPDDGSHHAVLLDRNLRVLTSIPFEGATARVELERVLKDESIRESELSQTGQTITSQAPVLFIPRVLEPGLCRHLQEIWSASHVETGVERSVDATRAEVIEAESKRRQDHVVEDPDLIRALTQTIGRRVLPEIRRSFNYAADRFEGFKISCYEASSSGFFHAHRDNLSPSTAHRRLAMSLNLNDDFAGGELCFPEFGPARYRPAAGEALVFACSMLHEVVPVTQGRRFTLLSFLFDAGASRTQRSEHAAQG